MPGRLADQPGVRHFRHDVIGLRASTDAICCGDMSNVLSVLIPNDGQLC